MGFWTSGSLAGPVSNTSSDEDGSCSDDSDSDPEEEEEEEEEEDSVLSISMDQVCLFFTSRSYTTFPSGLYSSQLLRFLRSSLGGI